MSDRYGYGYGDEAARRSAVREDEPAEPPEEATAGEEPVAGEATEPGNGVVAGAAARVEVTEEPEAPAEPEASAATDQPEEIVAEPVEPGEATAGRLADAPVFDLPGEEVAVEAQVEVTEAPEAEVVEAESLLESIDPEAIRARFVEIQASFVDEPRQAVQEAERYVNELVTELVGALERQRAQLRGTIEGGSTEELRLALRGYREFVDRLLGMRL